MEQKVYAGAREEKTENSKHNKSCLQDEACLRITTESPDANYDTSMHTFECSQKSSDNLPAPTPTSPLRRSPSAAGQRSRLRSKYPFRSCRSENQNTSVILPRR